MRFSRKIPLLFFPVVLAGQDSLIFLNIAERSDSTEVQTLQALIAPRPGQGVYDWSFMAVLGPPGFSWQGSATLRRFPGLLFGGHGAVGVNFGSQYFQEDIFLGYTKSGRSEEEEYYGSGNYLRGDLILSYPGIITSTIYGGAGLALHLATREIYRVDPATRIASSPTRISEGKVGLSAHFGIRATIMYMGTDIQIGVMPGRDAMEIYRSVGLVMESDVNDKRFYKFVAKSGIVLILSFIVYAGLLGFPVF